MSQVEKIGKMIFSKYEEGDVFTTKDVHRLAVENGIIGEKNNTAVSNTLFQLKKDIRVKSVGRGVYELNCVNSCLEEGESTEKLFEQLIRKLKVYKAMNPVNVDKETMVKASEEVDKYRKNVQILQTLLESN